MIIYRIYKKNLPFQKPLKEVGMAQAKESACSVGVLGSILGLGRCPGEGNGYPFQYSCPGNPMNRGAWWATVHTVAESDMTE